jgi:hypothetical protein
MELGTLMDEILDLGISKNSVVELKSEGHEFNIAMVPTKGKELLILYVNEDNNISITLDMITKDNPKKETRLIDFVSEIFGQSRKATKKSEVFLQGETEDNYGEFDIDEIVADGDKIIFCLSGGEYENEVYEIACNNCNTDFEAESGDVGYPPFTAECPNCGAEIDYD